jgi:ring-1,2-phenylacetyl-CoA epoxidase subunit PaaC
VSAAPVSAAVRRAGDPAQVAAHCRYVLRLADTSLVLGQRLSEWIGHSPALEEDLGLANLALDLIGQARLLLSYAGELEGHGRDEDTLAFLRDAPEFSNLTLAEQPNGDFGQTIVRQWLIDCWQLELYQDLSASADTRLAAIAAKALRETRYHHRFSSGWLVRLGDGTPESHQRVQRALDDLWRFTAELFAPDDVDERMHAAGIAPALPQLAVRWSARIDEDLQAATLTRPAAIPYPWHGKRGVHTEHLGHMLSEMQHLQRTYPGARW